MTRNTALFLAVAALAAASCNKENKPGAEPFKNATVLDIDDNKFTTVNAGATKTFNVTTDGDYTVTVDEGDWLSWEQTDSTLTVKITGPLDDNNERKATLTLASGSLEQYILVDLKKAAILDVTFNEDGTASDASSLKNGIQSYVGGNTATYYNEDFGKWVAHFTQDPGSSALSGYYKYDYSNDTAVKNKIADGFTVETVVSVGEMPTTSDGMCALASYIDGGVSLGVTGSSTMNRIAMQGRFNNKATLITDSHSAKIGKYYHIVGTWDKEAGVAKLYVDGKLLKSEKASSFTVPSAKTAEWFCIGGNSSKTDPQNSWCGDVITAKVYDAVFDSLEVARHYEALPQEAVPSSIVITGVNFIPEYATTSGSILGIAGTGFKSGDAVSLHDMNKGTDIALSATFTDARAAVTLDPSMTDGTYRIDIKRGSEMLSLGVIKIRFVEAAAVTRRPNIIAHRGVHNTGAPENSIEALKLAQEGGYYGSETDVWLTTDDSLMVNHDGVIGGYTIRKSTYATMRTVKLSNGEVLPTLSEYLMQERKTTGTLLIIEIKDHDTTERTLEAAAASVAMVKRMGMQQYVEYIAFSHAACLKIRELDPEARIGYLNGDVTPEKLAEEKINTMDYSYSIILSSHPEYIERGHNLGVTTNIWTVDDRNTMMNCIAKCADFITTDYPETVKSISDQLFSE